MPFFFPCAVSPHGAQLIVLNLHAHTSSAVLEINGTAAGFLPKERVTFYKKNTCNSYIARYSYNSVRGETNACYHDVTLIAAFSFF